MARPAKINSLQFGEIRQRPKPKHSQAHPGVSPLNPVSHRNTSFQPLPRPLGLPPYHYDLANYFPSIVDTINLKSDEFSSVFLRCLPFGDGRQPTAQ